MAKKSLLDFLLDLTEIVDMDPTHTVEEVSHILKGMKPDKNNKNGKSKEVNKK